MTAPRDPNQLIDAFLAEGQTDLPEQVYDEVRAEIEHTGQRTIFGPWNSPAFLRFGALAATAAVVALAVIIGLQLGAPSNTPAGPVTVGVADSVTEGDFRLTITSPSATWGSDEAIEVEATLEYLGNAAETTIWGSGSGPLASAWTRFPAIGTWAALSRPIAHRTSSVITRQANHRSVPEVRRLQPR